MLGTIFASCSYHEPEFLRLLRSLDRALVCLRAVTDNDVLIQIRRSGQPLRPAGLSRWLVRRTAAAAATELWIW